MVNNLFWLVPASSVVALALAFYFFRWMKSQDEGTDTMKKIASHVRQGAMSYLRQQYKIVTVVF
ncbi:MAG: sodium/proton-translocating pyrophosphatase, partial [Muribaculaceae bacterium]|nr:sodium/proton-translocating pyrophosphatase [Muribaculaceae bacterium]